MSDERTFVMVDDGLAGAKSSSVFLHFNLVF